MNGKQNFIFFVGLSLIALNFLINGQFKTLAIGIFGTPPKGGLKAKGNIPAQNLVPTPFGMIPLP